MIFQLHALSPGLVLRRLLTARAAPAQGPAATSMPARRMASPPLTLDAFPVHPFGHGKWLPGFAARCLLAWRVRRYTGPVLVTGHEARRCYSRVLVPCLPGTAASNAASIAAGLAAGRQLAFLRPYRLDESGGCGADAMETDFARRIVARDRARSHLAGLVDTLDLACGMVSRVVQYGHAEHVVTSYAKRMSADLIILPMPARHSGLWSQGVDLAARVVAHTVADVLLVPPAAPAD